MKTRWASRYYRISCFIRRTVRLLKHMKMALMNIYISHCSQTISELLPPPGEPGSCESHSPVVVATPPPCLAMSPEDLIELALAAGDSAPKALKLRPGKTIPSYPLQPATPSALIRWNDIDLQLPSGLDFVDCAADPPGSMMDLLREQTLFYSKHSPGSISAWCEWRLLLLIRASTLIAAVSTGPSSIGQLTQYHPMVEIALHIFLTSTECRWITYLAGIYNALAGAGGGDPLVNKGTSRSAILALVCWAYRSATGVEPEALSSIIHANPAFRAQTRFLALSPGRLPRDLTKKSATTSVPIAVATGKSRPSGESSSKSPIPLPADPLLPVPTTSFGEVINADLNVALRDIPLSDARMTFALIADGAAPQSKHLVPGTTSSRHWWNDVGMEVLTSTTGIDAAGSENLFSFTVTNLPSAWYVRDDEAAIDSVRLNIIASLVQNYKVARATAHAMVLAGLCSISFTPPQPKCGIVGAIRCLVLPDYTVAWNTVTYYSATTPKRPKFTTPACRPPPAVVTPEITYTAPQPGSDAKTQGVPIRPPASRLAVHTNVVLASDDPAHITEGALYVGNLPFRGTAVEELRGMFARFGPLLRFHLPRDEHGSGCRGYAFVTYERVEHASRAMVKLQGSDVGGRSIRISVAQPPAVPSPHVVPPRKMPDNKTMDRARPTAKRLAPCQVDHLDSHPPLQRKKLRVGTACASLDTTSSSRSIKRGPSGPQIEDPPPRVPEPRASSVPRRLPSASGNTRTHDEQDTAANERTRPLPNPQVTTRTDSLSRAEVQSLIDSRLADLAGRRQVLSLVVCTHLSLSDDYLSHSPGGTCHCCRTDPHLDAELSTASRAVAPVRLGSPRLYPLPPPPRGVGPGTAPPGGKPTHHGPPPTNPSATWRAVACPTSTRWVLASASASSAAVESSGRIHASTTCLTRSVVVDRTRASSARHFNGGLGIAGSRENHNVWRQAITVIYHCAFQSVLVNSPFFAMCHCVTLWALCPEPMPIFDPTLGFPGEGPLTPSSLAAANVSTTTPVNVIIGCWNLRKKGTSEATLARLALLLKTERIDILCIQESGWKEVIPVSSSLGSYKCAADVHQHGLAFMFDSNTWCDPVLTSIPNTSRMSCALFCRRDNPQRLAITNLHATATVSRAKFTHTVECAFQWLHERRLLGMHVVAVGDFNATTEHLPDPEIFDDSHQNYVPARCRGPSQVTPSPKLERELRGDQLWEAIGAGVMCIMNGRFQTSADGVITRHPDMQQASAGTVGTVLDYIIQPIDQITRAQICLVIQNSRLTVNSDHSLIILASSTPDHQGSPLHDDGLPPPSWASTGLFQSNRKRRKFRGSALTTPTRNSSCKRTLDGSRMPSEPPVAGDHTDPAASDETPSNPLPPNFIQLPTCGEDWHLDESCTRDYEHCLQKELATILDDSALIGLVRLNRQTEVPYMEILYRRLLLAYRTAVITCVDTTHIPPLPTPESITSENNEQRFPSNKRQKPMTPSYTEAIWYDKEVTIIAHQIHSVQTRLRMVAKSRQFSADRLFCTGITKGEYESILVKQHRALELKIQQVVNRKNRQLGMGIDHAFTRSRFDPRYSRHPWLLMQKAAARINGGSSTIAARMRCKDGTIALSGSSSAAAWVAAWSPMGVFNIDDPNFPIASAVATIAKANEQHTVQQDNTPEIEVPQDEKDLLSDISLTEIRAAIKMLNMYKTPGLDMLTPALIKKGPRELTVEILQILLQFVFKTGKLPEAWNYIFGSPLHKKGDKQDPLNHRILSLLASVRKIYENILYWRLRRFVEGRQLLHPNQSGFRMRRNCEHVVYILNMIRDISPTGAYVAFIDIRKAFPTTFRDKLWTTLHDMGVRGRFLLALRGLYLKPMMVLKVEGFDFATHAYPIDNGLLEGSPLSPFLYIIFVNCILTSLEASGLGCTFGGIWLGALMFADDLTLIARSPAELQEQLVILNELAETHRFTINADVKDTSVLTFRPHTMRHSSAQALARAETGMSWTCGSVPLTCKSTYRFLGVWIDQQRLGKTHVQKLKAKCYSAVYIVATRGVRFGVIGILQGIRVINSILVPQLTYCMSQWMPVSMEKTYIDTVNDSLYTAISRVVGLRPRPQANPQCIVFREFFILDATSLYYRQMTRLYHELFLCSLSTTAGRVFRAAEMGDLTGTGRHAWNLTVRTVLKTLGLPSLSSATALGWAASCHESTHTNILEETGVFITNPPCNWVLGDNQASPCHNVYALLDNPQSGSEWTILSKAAIWNDWHRRYEKEDTTAPGGYSRRAEQNRLLSLESEGTLDWLHGESQSWPLVLAARLSILSIGGQLGGRIEKVHGCHKCPSTQWAGLDHFLWFCNGTRIPAQALRLQIDSITGIDMTLPMLRTLSEDSAIHFLLGARTTLPQSLAHADSTAIKREVIIAMNSFLTTFTEVHPAAIGFV